MPQDETATTASPDATDAKVDATAAEPAAGDAPAGRPDTASPDAPAPRRDRLPLLMRLYGLYNLVTGGIVLVIIGLKAFFG